MYTNTTKKLTIRLSRLKKFKSCVYFENTSYVNKNALVEINVVQIHLNIGNIIRIHRIEN